MIMARGSVSAPPAVTIDQPTTAAASAGRVLWPLAFLILVGGVLRFSRLGANSLWIDEFMTLWVAGHSPTEIVRISSTVNFIPPLYFLLVHGALQIFGESEVALRLTSAVAGTCTIPVVWLLAEALTKSRRAATLVGALLAVNPLHLWFSQEARPYAVLLLFGCCGLVCLERAMRDQNWRYWVAFSSCGILTTLTHTTGLIFGLVAWAWALQSPNRPRILRPLVVTCLAVGLSCAPFLVAITRALAESHMTFNSAPRALTGLEVPYNVVTYITGLSFGPAPREIQNLGALAALWSHPFQAGVAGSVLVAVIVAWWVTRRRAMMGFAALFCIPLAGILALSALSGKAYNVRYTLPALVGFIGLVSMAALALKPTARTYLLAALFAVALWSDAQLFGSTRYAKEDSRAAVAWLRDNLVPGARVAVAPNYSIEPLKYYARQVGVELRFFAAPRGGGFAGDTTFDALVLTRLHHVPNWHELRASFQSLVGVRVYEGRVAGYELLVRNPPKHSLGN